MPLHPFSSRLFPDTVTVYPVGHSSGGHGGDPAAPGTGVALAARVLEVQKADRVNGEEQVFGVNYYEVTTATDPGVVADARIDWHGRHLAAVAPSTDIGGEGRRWRTYCREMS